MELVKRRSRHRSVFWNLIPRPLPNSLAWDFLYLVELLILQDFIIPQIFAQKIFVDLITPWLMIVFVFRSPLKILSVSALAILLLETHSGFPRGLLACLYWMMGVCVYSLRHHISWASFLPWIAVFFLSQVLVNSLEAVAFWTQNFSPFSFFSFSFLSILVNGMLSCFFGLFVIYTSRLDTLEEYSLARR